MTVHPEELRTHRTASLFDITHYDNKKDWKMALEWHDLMEICYIVSGTGVYFIEDRIYTFGVGDLFVIGRDELHKSELIEGQSFEVIVVEFSAKLVDIIKLDDGFNALSLFTDRPADFKHQLKTALPLRNRLNDYFNHLFYEYERNEGYSLRLVASMLQMIIVELQRGFDAQASIIPVENHHEFKMPKLVSDTIGYIYKFYKNDISLNSIAKDLNINPSYLSRLFRKHAGATVNEFISIKRINEARTLLLTTDMKVTEIALDAGFNHVTHFNWVFKKIIGMNPRDFRVQSKRTLN